MSRKVFVEFSNIKGGVKAYADYLKDAFDEVTVVLELGPNPSELGNHGEYRITESLWRASMTRRREDLAEALVRAAIIKK